MSDFNRIFITGDKHGAYLDFLEKAERYGIDKGDLVIIVGDHGLLFDNGKHDIFAKNQVSKCKATFLLIHGNHERRPTSEDIRWEYTPKEWCNGIVYVEKDRPRLLFAKDGERYTINNREYLVIGGAYSPDKPMRIRNNWGWFPDEQLSDEEKKEIIKKIEEHGCQEDIILSHTCPYNYQPIDCFMPGLDQSSIDKSMENFLQYVIEHCNYQYNKWYCGHWHIDRTVNKIRFLSDDIVIVSDDRRDGGNKND